MIGITILGSTGSIGINTLDVIARHPDRFKVTALTANKNVQRLFEQCQRWQPEYAVMVDPAAAGVLQEKLKSAGSMTTVLSGEQALCEVCALPNSDFVMAAIVGAAGLLPTLEAARHGKRLLLANKEALVMSGQLLMDTVQESRAALLPIDSEHNALFQCMCLSSPYSNNQDQRIDIKKILLTASGGPFWNAPVSELNKVTPEQACRHPNWSMGNKISVDSATMMNKGLEVIEACWLFNIALDKVEVLVHPQSVVHSMVSYLDGSVLAQLGHPDMRIPIAHALAWPDRIDSGAIELDLLATGRLDFLEPDHARFPCLQLAREAMRMGGTATTILNAANEVAVAHFLNNEIRFLDLSVIVEKTLEQVERHEADMLEVILLDDELARAHAKRLIAELN